MALECPAPVCSERQGRETRKLETTLIIPSYAMRERTAVSSPKRLPTSLLKRHLTVYP